GRVLERSLMISVSVESSRSQWTLSTVINWPSLSTSLSHVRRSGISIVALSRLSWISSSNRSSSSIATLRSKRLERLKLMEQLKRLLSALSGRLGSKRRVDSLPPLVFCVGLFTIEVERFQHRSIRKRKQDRALVTQTVGMIMPHPRWETKDISRRPIEALSV